jgi:hypothetical protein
MTLSLNRYANGDTDYVPKMDQDNTALELAINALQAALSTSGVSTGPYLTALFGTQLAFIGSSSYTQSTASTTMTLTAGYLWRPDLPAIVSKGTSTALNFSGQSAATYYILIDASGIPSIVGSATFATYSVVWTGSAFGTITRLVPIVWSFGDWEAAQVSTALGATYDSLDARLEAGELAAVAPFAVSVSDSPGASVNDYAPSGWNAAKTRRLLTTAASGGTTYTGFDSTGVQDGACIYVRNPSTTDLGKITHLDTGSLLANRVSCPGAGEYDVPPLSGFFLIRVGIIWTIR